MVAKNTDVETTGIKLIGCQNVFPTNEESKYFDNALFYAVSL